MRDASKTKDIIKLIIRHPTLVNSQKLCQDRGVTSSERGRYENQTS